MKRQFINTLIFCSQRTTVFRAYSFSPSFYCQKRFSSPINTELDSDNKLVLNKTPKILHGNIFLHPEILKIVLPKYFKNRLLKYYDINLYKVLVNDKIISTTIKVKFITPPENYKSLSSQFGYKFNYNELKKWDFSKSPYFKILIDYCNNIYIPGKQKTDENLYLINQFDYTFSNHKAPLNLDQFFTRYVGSILDMLEEYEGLKPEYFFISFKLFPFSINHDKKTINNINKISFKKGISNIKEIKKTFRSDFLPLTLDEQKYGIRKYSTRTFVNEKIKTVIKDISPTKTLKEIYSVKDNKHLDTFIDDMENYNTFTRYSKKNKTSVTIRDDKVIRTSIKTNFKPIKYYPPKNDQKNTFNKHFGTFDIETYYNSLVDRFDVYALGFCYAGGNVLLKTPEAKTYYLEKGKTSYEIVLDCINEMLSNKYKKSIFYTHNLAGFDVVFILKVLAEYNKNNNKEYYKIKATLKDSEIIKLQISVKRKTVNYSIILVDSLSLLPMSLSFLSKTFITKFKKPFFPYTFVTDKTLFYVGKTPDIEFFHNLKEDMCFEDYLKNLKSCWDLKKETLKYLESDLISLCQIMYEFSQYIYEQYNVQVSECLTITSLSLKIFFKNYYNKENKENNFLPLIRKRAVYDDIKKGYYGGLSEVYIGYGENLYYYDVNSLYPFNALYDMPGIFCDYLEAHNNEVLDVTRDKLFGFFYCKVKTPKNDYIGFLPYRLNGILTYPLGEFSGWFFTNQISFAKRQKYDIKILKGYKFNRAKNVFEGYIKTLYETKKNTTGPKRLITKLLLNALLGRFGMHIDKKNTTLVTTKEKYIELLTKYTVYSEKEINENTFLVTHSSDISQTICEQHGFDYLDVKSELDGGKLEKEESSDINNVSISASAAVTANSSIFMSKVKKYILEHGGKIYYTDTDSIVTNIPLPPQHIGIDIGQFKLEHKIKRGYFISSKLYCLIVEDNGKEKEIIKSKGVMASKLTEKDFIAMYSGKKIECGVKTFSKKEYSEGSVHLGKKTNINLNPMTFKKRIKILDSNNKWIDTKPLVIKENFDEGKN